MVRKGGSSTKRIRGDKCKPLPQDDWHLSFCAWDLDGVFVRDLAPEEDDADLRGALAHRDELAPFERTPDVANRNAVIITARPMQDAERTRRW
jgi:hypothetical protein